MYINDLRQETATALDPEMATKTISIDLEAYRCLKTRKRRNESFSEVIKRILSVPFDVKAWLTSLEDTPLSKNAMDAIDKKIK